jgi:hypothetical protein
MMALHLKFDFQPACDPEPDDDLSRAQVTDEESRARHGGEKAEHDCDAHGCSETWRRLPSGAWGRRP